MCIRDSNLAALVGLGSRAPREGPRRRRLLRSRARWQHRGAGTARRPLRQRFGRPARRLNPGQPGLAGWSGQAGALRGCAPTPAPATTTTALPIPSSHTNSRPGCGYPPEAHLLNQMRPRPSESAMARLRSSGPFRHLGRPLEVLTGFPRWVRRNHLRLAMVVRAGIPLSAHSLTWCAGPVRAVPGRAATGRRRSCPPGMR